MNHLNSVLIEGIVSDRDGEPTGEPFVFILTADRFVKLDSKLEKTQVNMPVFTYGRLAKSCAEYLPLGRGARVVGRLGQDVGGFHVVAEHVEFKTWLPPKAENLPPVEVEAKVLVG